MQSCIFVLQTLAVLAAVTEVIKSQGGTDNKTTYFAALVGHCLKLIASGFS